MSTGTDPVRLIADPACPESQRALLQHGTSIEPPPGAEARVWLALAGAVGAAAGGAAAADASTKTITTATATGVKTDLVSMKIVAIVVGLVGLGALVALGRALFVPAKPPTMPAAVAPPPAVEPPTAPSPAPQAPPAAEAQPREAPPPADVAPARAAVPAHRSVRTTSSSSARRLGEETTLIRDARQALRAGDPARALQLLEQSRRMFPTGVLEQERERLAIEALVKAGRTPEASARASAFLRKYPDSPHAAEIRARGLGTPGGR